MSEYIHVGMIGFGNVGQGVASILHTNQQIIAKRIGQTVKIKTVCVRDMDKYHDIAGTVTLTTSVNDVLNDPDIDIVVEVIGGEQPAFDYITAALNNKKYVVTANKELIAKHKQSLFALAKKNDVDIFFEASVGGGIPIIKSFKVGYSANQIESVYGILNGTTNFILTQLFESKTEFSTVLKEAQKRGFAEADPTADISGLDAAYKIVILTAVALKADIQIDDVFYEGIESISLKDAHYLDGLGYRIRLIAKAQRMGESLSVGVFPVAIPTDHPLAMVRNEFNAIFCTGNMVGESMIYGKGAGSLPTGSAVVSDILDIAFDIHTHQSRRNLEANLQPISVVPMHEQSSSFYCRLILKDETGALETMSSMVKAAGINIAQLVQKERSDGMAELVLITDQANEGVFSRLVSDIKQSTVVHSVAAIIRVGLQ